jgi:hypothetical protein
MRGTPLRIPFLGEIKSFFMVGQHHANQYFHRTIATVWRKAQVTFKKMHRSGAGVLGCKYDRS